MRFRPKRESDSEKQEQKKSDHPLILKGSFRSDRVDGIGFKMGGSSDFFRAYFPESLSRLGLKHIDFCTVIFVHLDPNGGAM